MERITTTEAPRKSGLVSKSLIALSLCGILTLSSCWGTTEKDVLKQQEEVERVNFQISSYIDARKKLVKDYNKLLNYPKTESNKWDINRSLAAMRSTIIEYDEMIWELAEDRLEAIDNLNRNVADLDVAVSFDTPIDENRRDFLLQ